MALPRRVLMMALAALCATPAFAQQPMLASNPIPVTGGDASNPGSTNAAPAANSGGHAQVNPEITEGGLFFRHFSIGTYGSPLGIGGRAAVSLAPTLNLRAGASYFSFTMSRTESNIPYTANVRLQSEQVNLDWYPFHNGFHLSPGVLFGNSNRVFGNATVPAGNSFTLNGVNYYSGSADPIQASGSVEFRHTSPTLTIGRGNWIRHEGQRHWVFPFEAGVAFTGDPKTALNYSGEVCIDAGQVHCQNIATDASVQANVTAERTKLQNDANWARFYPIIAGGIVYRF
jgi:hypothetical protein